MASYLTPSDIVLQWSADPLSDVTPTYVTVDTSEILHLEWWAGVEREGNDPEPGGMVVRLKNVNRKWEPLFGSNTISTHQRFKLTLDGTAEGVWYSTDFDLSFPTGQEYSEVTITCADGFEVLALDDLPSLDPPDAQSYEDVVSTDEPWGYWRFGESDGTQATAMFRKTRWFTSLSGGQKVRRRLRRPSGMRYSRPPAEGVAGPAGILRDAAGLSHFGGGSLIVGDSNQSLFLSPSGQVRAPVEDATSFVACNCVTMELWAAVAGVGRLASGPFLTSAGNGIFELIGVDGANFQFRVVLSGGEVTCTGSTVIERFVTYYVVGMWDGREASLFVDGVLEDVETGSGVLVAGDASEFWYPAGSNVSVNVSCQGFVDEVAFYERALSTERILAHYTAGASRGFPEQTAGTRIAAIANSDLWSEASIQTTGRNVIPQMMFGQSRIEEIAELMHAEGPRTLFFFNGSGNPVYLGHEWKGTAAVYNTVQATFTDDGTGIPYDAFEPLFDNETYNSVEASREGGALVTVTDTAASATRRRRNNSEFTDLLLTDDVYVESLAGHVLDLYAEPTWRISSLTVNGAKALAKILSLDIGHLIRVKKQGVTGGALNRVSHIIGKRKLIDADRHLTCKWTLGRGFDGATTYWRLGVVGYSELGTTTKIT